MNLKFYNINTKLGFVRAKKKKILMDKLPVSQKQNCRIFLNYSPNIWKNSNLSKGPTPVLYPKESSNQQP